MSKIDLVEELHRSARRNFARRKTSMRGIQDTVQADLVEMIPYARENRNNKYILVAINIFSKKAYARPLRTKSGRDVSEALRFWTLWAIPFGCYTSTWVENFTTALFNEC